MSRPHRSVSGLGGARRPRGRRRPRRAGARGRRECGEHGSRGWWWSPPGTPRAARRAGRQRELVRQARTYGMRIIGPNAFGVINTSPEVRLNASLAPEMPRPGRIGLFAQSGAIGIALLSGLHRAAASPATGVSTFISSGNRADVSGNDVLQYWYDDPDTDVALMYLESIGNPRKFTRLARRTAAAKPLVVVQGARHSGACPPGTPSAPPDSRTRPSRPSCARPACIRVGHHHRTRRRRPAAGPPAAARPGPRVAIVGNSESLGLLTYDACLTEGLRPLPPKDLTTAASAADFHAGAGATRWPTRRATRSSSRRSRAVGEPSTADAALAEALRSGGRRGPRQAGPRRARRAGRASPRHPPPRQPRAPQAADAARAAHPRGPARHPADGAPPAAGEAPLTADARPSSPPTPPPSAPSAPSPRPSSTPSGGASRRARARCPSTRTSTRRAAAAADRRAPRARRGPDPRRRGRPARCSAGTASACAARCPPPARTTAVAAAGTIGYPVALKTTAPHLRHRADLGGVRLDLADEEQLRRGVRAS